MVELPFLEGYGGQTTDELLALADRYRVDSLVLAFEQGVERAMEKRGGWSALSVAEQTVLAVEAFERDVNNGGFDQWLINTSTEMVGVTAEALRRIGCEETAALVDVATAIAAQHDEDARFEALEPLDGRFYTLTEPVAERLFEYVRTERANVSLGR